MNDATDFGFIRMADYPEQYRKMKERAEAAEAKLAALRAAFAAPAPSAPASEGEVYTVRRVDVRPEHMPDEAQMTTDRCHLKPGDVVYVTRVRGGEG